MHDIRASAQIASRCFSGRSRWQRRKRHGLLLRVLCFPRHLFLVFALELLGMATVASSTALGRTRAVPAPGPPKPAVLRYGWNCENSTDDERGSVSFRVGLRQLPAVSADGHLAIGAQEMVPDDESDHPPPPPPSIAPDREWKTDERVVVYFVDLDTNRAEPAIGVLSSPNYNEQYLPCSRARRRFDKLFAGINGRLASRTWAPLIPLALNLRSPVEDAYTTKRQKRGIGNAAIEFRFPNLIIRLGQGRERAEKHRIVMATYPSRTRAEVFGYLDFEPAGSRTWLTDLWLEPVNGVLVLRLMNQQLSDCVLGNAFEYFLRISREEVVALCPSCGSPPPP
jgi:hypothetical protein